ncbi:MAG: imidazolonepropionase [Phycisphaerales bacterium]|nr:imidazolonepropionase [Phycisphaerales bacterium]
MKMPESSTAIINARILTLANGNLPRRGEQMSSLSPIESGTVLIRDGRIAQVGTTVETPADAHIIDAKGRVVMPAFVDCHTHACWAGDRLDEWEQKQSGATYLDILKAGGGIMSTVRAVRDASVEQLTEQLLQRLDIMLREGTTSCEIKSGYGLSTKDELKMLDAIHRASKSWVGRISATACIGHAIDPDVPHFVDLVINETLPAVHEKYPGITIDAYTEDGAWSVDETIRLFERAKELGHPLRIHADQFNTLGMVEAAIELGALSVDHLEATKPESLARLAQSETIGVMLPCSGFHVDARYADGRGFIDAGGALAIATNANPGSAPCFSMPMSIALAVRNLGITAAEAINASTVNGAHLLGFDDLGTTAVGQQANLIILRHRDERQLGYEFGGRHVDQVICNGKIVFNAHA